MFALQRFVRIPETFFFPNPKSNYLTWLDAELSYLWFWQRHSGSRSCFKIFVLWFGPSYLSVVNTILFTASSPPNEMTVSRLSVFLIHKQAPPHANTQVLSAFIHTHKLHAHAVRPMSGTAAHPFHFMVNCAGCEGSVRSCLEVLYVQFCVFCPCSKFVCVPAGCIYLHHSVSVCICTHSCLCNTAQLCVIQTKFQSF